MADILIQIGKRGADQRTRLRQIDSRQRPNGVTSPRSGIRENSVPAIRRSGILTNSATLQDRANRP